MPLLGVGGSTLPERGQYMVVHVDEAGKMWAAIHITRDFLLNVEEPGEAIVKMLDDKIDRLRRGSAVVYRDPKDEEVT